MVVVLGAEVAQRGKDRVGRRLPQPAQGRNLDLRGQLLQHGDVLLLALALGDAGEDLEHPLRPDAAEGALPARLALDEGEEVAGHVHHAGGLVHDDHAAGAHDGTRCGE